MISQLTFNSEAEAERSQVGETGRSPSRKKINFQFIANYFERLSRLYTVNHKKRDILFLTITFANFNRFL